MIKKRSKFWTVVLAFIPGAGHMVNGFMRRGVSFTVLFWGIAFLATLLNFGAICLLLPIIWFFAFFDCINLRFQDDEVFYAQEDRFLIELDEMKGSGLLENRNIWMIFGVILIIIGCASLWHGIIAPAIWNTVYLPMFLRNIILELGRLVPQLIVAALVIWAGVRLVKGKKEELKEEPGETSSKTDKNNTDGNRDS